MGNVIYGNRLNCYETVELCKFFDSIINFCLRVVNLISFSLKNINDNL